MTKNKQAYLPELLRAPDVAAMLGIGVSTVWQWAREGGFPEPVRLSSGRVTAWRRADIEQWLQTPYVQQFHPSDFAPRREVVAKKIVIEKGVPLPHRKPPHEAKYPVRKMVVGDSFFVPEGTTTTLSPVRRQAERWGMKLLCRGVEGGVRVWRVK